MPPKRVTLSNSQNMNFVYSSQQIKLVNSLDRYISLKTINTMRQTTIESYLNQ